MAWVSEWVSASKWDTKWWKKEEWESLPFFFEVRSWLLCPRSGNLMGQLIFFSFDYRCMVILPIIVVCKWFIRFLVFSSYSNSFWPILGSGILFSPSSIPSKESPCFLGLIIFRVANFFFLLSSSCLKHAHFVSQVYHWLHACISYVSSKTSFGKILSWWWGRSTCSAKTGLRRDRLYAQ